MMFREEVLDNARECIVQERAQQYGESFTTIAKLWSAYFQREISEHDVCMALALLKVGRVAHNPKHMDSTVDAVGYLALSAEFT